MLTLDEIKSILSNEKHRLNNEFKVKNLWIFGSYARGEQKEASDIDILVEFSENVGWEFFELGTFLEDLLSIKVDLVTHKALRNELKETILSEVVAV